MAFNAAMEPYYIGLCVFIFCGATFALVTVNDKYTRYENATKEKIEMHSEVNQMYATDGYPEEEQIELTGAAVITEIMDEDGSIPIRVNNELLNDIDNVNSSNLKFFPYMREYGTDFLAKKISLTAKYLKIISIDENGNIAEVNYIVN